MTLDYTRDLNEEEDNNTTLNNIESAGNNQISNERILYNWVMKELIKHSHNYSNEKLNLVHIDINKTRRNILVHNKNQIPVHTVLDNVEDFKPIDEVTAGLYYVQTQCYFPITGDGWYA